MLSSQGAHNIDDVLLSLKLESKVGSKKASFLFTLLEWTYHQLGYIIDRANSLLSDRKYVLYFVDGMELMIPLKTTIRAALSLKNDIPFSLHSKVNSKYIPCHPPIFRHHVALTP